MKIIRRISRSAVIGAMIALFAWFAVSFAEINAQNLNKTPEYGKYNVFRIITGHEES